MAQIHRRSSVSVLPRLSCQSAKVEFGSSGRLAIGACGDIVLHLYVRPRDVD